MNQTPSGVVPIQARSTRFTHGDRRRGFPIHCDRPNMLGNNFPDLADPGFEYFMITTLKSFALQ